MQVHGETMDQRYDVTILGYGPEGAVLANLLGRDGLSVTVVDRMHAIYDKPRAINIDHEVMRLLQSVGLAAVVEPITCHHTGTEFRGLDDRLIKVFRPMQPPYPLGWAPNLMFIQPEFEPLLPDGRARQPTVDVMLGQEALALEQDADEVRLVLDGDAGQPGLRRAMDRGGRPGAGRNQGAGLHDAVLPAIGSHHIRGRPLRPAPLGTQAAAA